MSQENPDKLKQLHAEGARYGMGMAIAIVKGYLEAWNDPRVIAAVPPDQAAARRDQLERVLKDLLECEIKLQ